MKLILASEFSDSFDQTKSFMGDISNKSVMMIYTAAVGEGFMPDPQTNIKPFEDLGAKVFSYDLKGKSVDDVREALSQIDMLYVCGGNTFYLLEHMKACDFETLLKQRLKEGMIYIGSSAGSIVCCPDIEFISPMDDASRASLADTKSLNLIDFIFLPHLGHSTMGDDANTILRGHEGPEKLFVLNDKQALIVEDDKVFIV